MHTSYGLGIQKSIGHKDFYVNGGDIQPGCILSDPLFIRCSHLRSIDLYAESITTKCSFKSVPCDSYSKIFLTIFLIFSYWTVINEILDNYKKGVCKCDPQMGCSSLGYRANLNNQQGDFYLMTNSKSPFCIE